MKEWSPSCATSASAFGPASASPTIRNRREVHGRPVALTDACKMEHLLSAESATRLVTFMGHYLTDTEKVERFQRVLRDYAGGFAITGPRLAG